MSTVNTLGAFGKIALKVLIYTCKLGFGVLRRSTSLIHGVVRFFA